MPGSYPVSCMLVPTELSAGNKSGGQVGNKTGMKAWKTALQLAQAPQAC